MHLKNSISPGHTIQLKINAFQSLRAVQLTASLFYRKNNSLQRSVSRYWHPEGGFILHIPGMIFIRPETRPVARRATTKGEKGNTSPDLLRCRGSGFQVSPRGKDAGQESSSPDFSVTTVRSHYIGWRASGRCSRSRAVSLTIAVQRGSRHAPPVSCTRSLPGYLSDFIKRVIYHSRAKKVARQDGPELSLIARTGQSPAERIVTRFDPLLLLIPP